MKSLLPAREETGKGTKKRNGRDEGRSGLWRRKKQLVSLRLTGHYPAVHGSSGEAFMPVRYLGGGGGG